MHDERPHFLDTHVVWHRKGSCFADTRERGNGILDEMRADLVTAEVENLLVPPRDDQHPALGQVADIPGIEMSVADWSIALAACAEIAANADRRPGKHHALLAGRHQRARFVNDAHGDIRGDMADGSRNTERMRRRG